MSAETATEDERRHLLGPPCTSDEADPELAIHGGPCDQKFEVGQVTIRLPLDLRPLPLLALGLSFAPWLAPCVLLTDAIAYRRFSSMFLLGLLLVCSALNELMLKPCIDQPRPVFTACRDHKGRPSAGMPSGHSLQWQLQVTWFALQAIWTWPTAHGIIEAMLLVLLASPLVPWARWYNGDHTVSQVLVSVALAIPIAVAAFFVFLQFKGTAPVEATPAGDTPVGLLSY